MSTDSPQPRRGRAKRLRRRANMKLRKLRVSAAHLRRRALGLRR